MVQVHPHQPFNNMKQELQDSLAKKFPTVFKNIDGDIRQTCMAWGITCGDGWYTIIHDLCILLESRGAVAEQVKEKYGTLRFYVSNTDDEVDTAITEAEKLSEKTCELCGKPGTLTTKHGWLMTRCLACTDTE